MHNPVVERNDWRILQRTGRFSHARLAITIVTTFQSIALPLALLINISIVFEAFLSFIKSSNDTEAQVAEQRVYLRGNQDRGSNS
jgi:hypothetical protein